MKLEWKNKGVVFSITNCIIHVHRLHKTQYKKKYLITHKFAVRYPSHKSVNSNNNLVNVGLYCLLPMYEWYNGEVLILFRSNHFWVVF